jgi:YNFM family putative membrane transporter
MPLPAVVLENLQYPIKVMPLLYLLFYYLGSSIVGAYGGNIWQSHGWNGIVILNIFLILIALIVIFSIKPLHSPSVTH